MAFDYKKARAEGATESQILEYLNKTRGYDTQSAIKAGASKTQVIDYLAQTSRGETATAKPFRYDVAESKEQKLGRLQGEAKQAEAFSTQENSFLGKTKNFFKADAMGNLPFVGGAVRVAKTLNKTIDGPASDEQQDYVATLSDRNFNLVKRIRDRRAKGLNTTAEEREFNSNADILDGYNKELGDYNASLPSNAQAGGQLAQMGLDVLTAGTYGKRTEGMKPFNLQSAKPSILPQGKNPLLSKETGKNILNALPAGYGYDVALGMQGDRGEDRMGGKALIPGFGTAISAAVPAVGGGYNSLRQVQANRTVLKPAKDALRYDRLVGTITQGNKRDIPKAKAALSYIDDPDSITSYDDLGQKLDEKIEVISSKLDDAFDQDTSVRTLDNLSVSQAVGGETVKHNYVEDALNQLEELYSNANDPIGAKKIQMLRKKAQTEGLTVRELNDLAKEHGSEISNKGFNKRTGEPTTSVSAQAFENTRSGIKGTARQVFNNPLYTETDTVLSNLIRTRKLVQDVASGVLKLKQKVSDRTLGEKAGRLVFQVVDKLSGGTVRGFVQSFIPRSGGLKVMNALDLEKNLQKNLKLLQEINDSKLPENKLIEKLEELLKGPAKGPATTPKTQGRANLPNPVKPTDAYGAVAGIEQDEEGNVSFSPTKAALGVAGVAGYAWVKKNNKNGGVFKRNTPIIKRDSKTGLPLNSMGLIDRKKVTRTPDYFEKQRLEYLEKTNNGYAKYWPEEWKREQMSKYIEDTNMRRQVRQADGRGKFLDSSRADFSYKQAEDAVKLTGSTIDNPKFRVIKEATPAKDLSPEYRELEDRAFAKLRANPQAAVDAYNALPNTMRGKLASADESRRVFEDIGYNGANAAAFQEPASALTKVIYELGLKRPGNVLLTAGGSGTGKTTAIKGLKGDLWDEAAVILDGNLSNIKSARVAIEKAHKAGKDVDIAYTYRDPIESFIDGVVARMLNNADEGGRLVPASVVANNHIGSYNVERELLDSLTSRNLKNVGFHLIDNTLGRGNQAPLSLEKFASIKYPSVEELSSQMVKEIKKLYEQQGKNLKRSITREEYQALIQ